MRRVVLFEIALRIGEQRRRRVRIDDRNRHARAVITAGDFTRDVVCGAHLRRGVSAQLIWERRRVPVPVCRVRGVDLLSVVRRARRCISESGWLRDFVAGRGRCGVSTSGRCRCGKRLVEAHGAGDRTCQAGGNREIRALEPEGLPADTIVGECRGKRVVDLRDGARHGNGHPVRGNRADLEAFLLQPRFRGCDR